MLDGDQGQVFTFSKGWLRNPQINKPLASRVKPTKLIVRTRAHPAEITGQRCKRADGKSVQLQEHGDSR